MHKVSARDSCVLVRIDGAIAEANLHTLQNCRYEKSSFWTRNTVAEKQAQLPVLVVSYLLRSVFMVPGCKIVGCQYD